MDEIVREFLIESRENLDQLESTLLEVEKTPGSQPLLSSLFRSVHSIKGSCGFLGFAKLEELLHVGETVLGRLRDGKLSIDGEVANALLMLVDAARRLLASIESTGSEGSLDVSAAMASLKAVAARSGATSVAEQRLPQVVDAPAVQVEAGPPLIGLEARGKIRVDVELLDRLMNLVGELVLARNHVVQSGVVPSQMGVTAPIQRLNLVTTELQETVMKTRLQSIGTIWNRIPRMVRDLANTLGKQVRLQLEGRETELDKNILEAVQDPLMHLVRNAVDHGLEVREARLAKGKTPEGTLTIRAYHEGGMVNIEVSDDGAGIDVEQIKRRVLQLQLVPAERLSRMSGRDALDLLFLPGFTTVDHPTTVSGRGVGMDVVRANIESMGGTVEVQTEVGVGTRIKVKLPLTLAIIPALIVGTDGQRYAIPQTSLVEVVRLESGRGSQGIELVQGAPVLRLRDKLLPIVHLDSVLDPSRPSHDASVVTVTVLQADDRMYGLVVDEIFDTEEIVVRPLWKRLRSLSCYAGATVMGDGRVALILDARGTGQRVGIIADVRQRETFEAKTSSREDMRTEDLVLVCRTAMDGRLAIPLSRVVRLEEFPGHRIERIGVQDVVRYQDDVLPIVHTEQVLRERRKHPRAATRRPDADIEGHKIQTVVLAHEGHPIGLVVDSILDIIPVRVHLHTHTARAGILGTMVVQERITEFLDVDQVVRAGTAGFRQARNSAESGGP